MKFYTYNITQMRDALVNTASFIGKGDPKSIEFNEDYPWFTLDWDCFKFVYPSGSLWHCKLNELVSEEPSLPPSSADYFLVPMAIFLGDRFTPLEKLNGFDEKVLSVFCHQLPYWQYNKAQHVFFVLGDSHFSPDGLKDSIIFRCSCHRESLDYPLHYDVILDMSNIRPIQECQCTCCFVGCLETHRVRHALPFIINAIKGKNIFESTPNFFADLPLETQEHMQQRWTKALNDSMFVLAPRGNGLTSIRFFEALAFGRIPILIADDTKLPLMDLIDYSQISIRVPERKMRDIPKLIEDFLKTHDVRTASLAARKVWKEYFSPGKFRSFIDLSLPAPKRAVIKNILM